MSVNDTRRIFNDINEAIKSHEDDCKANNDLRYVRMPNLFVQIFSIMSFVAIIIAGLAAYYNAEADQNDRITTLEVDGNKKFDIIIQKLDKIGGEK